MQGGRKVLPTAYRYQQPFFLLARWLQFLHYDIAPLIQRRWGRVGGGELYWSVRVVDTILTKAFEDIYRQDRWTNGSGPGSSITSTIEYRGFIERFMKENGVRSVTDVGCGDWQFSKTIDWSGIQYTGFDIVDFIIESNRKAYGRENIQFQMLNNIADLPGGDLLLCKEVLQHLPNAVITEYVDQIRLKYKFALITNAIEPLNIANGDIEPGDWRPLRMDRAPFHVRGATVFIYFPQSGSHFWRNGVFLMIGEG